MFGVGLLKIVAFSWARGSMWERVVVTTLECVFLFVGSLCKAFEALGGSRGGGGGFMVCERGKSGEDVALVIRPSTVEAKRERESNIQYVCVLPEYYFSRNSSKVVWPGLEASRGLHKLLVPYMNPSVGESLRPLPMPRYCRYCTVH